MSQQPATAPNIERINYVIAYCNSNKIRLTVNNLIIYSLLSAGGTLAHTDTKILKQAITAANQRKKK